MCCIWQPRYDALVRACIRHQVIGTDGWSPRWYCIDQPSIPASSLIPNVIRALLTLCSHVVAFMASFARIVSYAACLLFRLFLALSFEVVCVHCYGIAVPRTKITIAGPQTRWIDLDYVASAEWPGKRPIAFRRTSSDNT